MKKFSKITESTDDLTSDIRNIFIDIIDENIKVNIQRFRSFYIIKINGDKYSDPLTIMSDILGATEKMHILGLKYITSNNDIDISIGKKINIFLKYQYGGINEKENKNVNNWQEFKDYCNNVLAIDGIKGDIFRINVVTPQGFPDLDDDLYGWEIDGGEGSIENLDAEFIKEFPEHADFFKMLLRRKLDWVNVWNPGKSDEKTNPLRFNKEGIEIVEKLLEIAKEYPDKIEVINT